MIQIKRAGTQVELSFDSKLKVSKNVYVFRWETNDENHAELMANHLAKVLHDAIQSARETAYNNGFVTGRSKRKRETWFAGWL